MNILHLTAHMGGGIGKAISDSLIAEKKMVTDVHMVYCLEKPMNFQYIEKCLTNGIDVKYTLSDKEMYKEMARVDIIVIHWWNHPAMARLLLNFPSLKVRVVFWIHVSGCTYPKLPFSLVDYMDYTIFTTPYTYKNPYWNKAEQEIARKKAFVIYGLGKLNNIPLKKSYDLRDDFVIGYVGTINISKLHPDIALYCKEVKIKIPNAKFIFVGENQLDYDIMQQIIDVGLFDSMEFTGYVDSVETQLQRFDVFGYPLNPYHYGSTENALLEPMSAGIPIVTLNHGAEGYIISDRINGFLANNPHQYADCMAELFESEELRSRLGRSAAHFVKKEYNLYRNIECLNNLLSKVYMVAPRDYDFQRIFGKEPHECFLSCIGSEREFFEKNLLKQKKQELPIILKGSSKGSIHQFAEYFKENEVLNKWSIELRSNGN